MIHLVLALIFQGVVGFTTGLWWQGAAIASTFYIAREHAQAEYRWIERYGLGRRANMPWWGPFDPRVWNNLHSWLDWVLPLVGTVMLAVLMN